MVINKRMVIKKDIVYPIFLECCQYAEDNFWKNIFDDLSYGKTPYGTYISKDFLCCGYKDKEFSYKIERKDPKEIYDNIYNLLTKKLGILSSKEKIKKRALFFQTENKLKNSRDSWVKIRKKNIKDILIERYVVEMRKQYSLTKKQGKYLLSIIFIAMIFKIITSKDIDYHEGKIHSIKGIVFQKNKIILKRGVYNIDVPLAPEIVIDKKVMSDNWLKYIENMKKLK